MPCFQRMVTVPAFASALLLKGMDEPAARLLEEIPYVSTCVVTLAFKKSDVAHAMNATGFVVAGNEVCRMTSCTWSSSKWEGRSPKDRVLVRCFFGKLGDEDILTHDDDALVHLACRDLNGILGISGEPIKHWVFRWNKAMPQYLVGHMDKVRRIEAGLNNFPGVFVLGSAYRGVGLPDCIKQARDVVDLISQRSTTAARQNLER